MDSNSSASKMSVGRSDTVLTISNSEVSWQSHWRTVLLVFVVSRIVLRYHSISSTTSIHSQSRSTYFLQI